MNKPFLFLLTCVAALFIATGARADAGPKIRDSLWLPVGLNVGYSVNPSPLDNGFLIGPELSFVYLSKQLYWAGVYGDTLRDFGSDATRVSATTLSPSRESRSIMGLSDGSARSAS